MAKGPVLIDLEQSDTPVPSVADAPPVVDVVPSADAPKRQAMQMAATLAARNPSRLVRWFWGLLVTLIGAVVSVAAWDFVTGLIARNPLLGYGVTAIFVAFLVVLGGIALRELAAFARLGRIDHLRHSATEARAGRDFAAAKDVSDQLLRLYGGREDTRWARERFTELRGDQLDAVGLLDLSERELLVTLDQMAAKEVQAAARQVATVTALVPLALADVVAALTANIRMIRRVAEIYGGRSGLLGGWRLTRAVLSHLVATGAVAVGEDMLEPVLGGGVLAKLSRRFGEGLVNGALTARVGVAAIEVCRPLPFSALERPRASRIVREALTGLFSSGGSS